MAEYSDQILLIKYLELLNPLSFLKPGLESGYLIRSVVEFSSWDGTDEALVELLSDISHDFLRELIFCVVV